MRIAAPLTASLMVAVAAQAQTQTPNFQLDRFHVLTKLPNALYTEIGLPIVEDNGNYLVETQGDTVSYPPSAGTLSELLRPAVAGGQWSGRRLFVFGSDSTGLNPAAEGLRGPDGRLFGTTANGGLTLGRFLTGGLVFAMQPPTTPGGAWTESVLHKFAGCTVTPCDGYSPSGSLVRDQHGTFYGVTDFGGTANGGTVFSLERDGGSWRERVLYSFAAQNLPYETFDGPTLDSAGNLFGTSVFGGTDGAGFVFELQHPASPGGAWVYRDLYDFTGKLDGGYPGTLAIDAAGTTLYGAAQSGGPYPFNGVVFQLAHKDKGGWAETVLHAFGGPGDGSGSLSQIVRADDGNLYGTTGFAQARPHNARDQGTVYQLRRPDTPGAPWTERQLHRFAYCGPHFSCPEGEGPFVVGIGKVQNKLQLDLLGLTGFDGYNAAIGTFFDIKLNPNLP